MLPYQKEIIPSGFSITISRQVGSFGAEVAQKAAALLGYRVVHRELINAAALRIGSPEVALANIDDLGLLGISVSSKQARAYRQAIQQVMDELAAEGNVVITGRAGQVILGEYPHVLHVRVIAPLDVRIERICERHQVDQAGAKAQIEASDRFRTRYLRRFYKVRWDDPLLYDLTINTGKLSVDTAAKTIFQALLTFAQQPQESYLDPVE